MRLRNRTTLLAILAIVGAVAGYLWYAGKDDRAAAYAMRQTARANNFLEVSGPTLLQNVPVDDGALVLFTYRFVPPLDPQPYFASALYFFRDEVLYYQPHGFFAADLYPDSGTSKLSEYYGPQPPVEFSFIQHSMAEGRTFVGVGGVVKDPAATHIAVRYSDGNREVVAVERHSYLTGRISVEQLDVVEVEALDAHGAVLHRAAGPER